MQQRSLFDSAPKETPKKQTAAESALAKAAPVVAAAKVDAPPEAIPHTIDEPHSPDQTTPPKEDLLKSDKNGKEVKQPRVYTVSEIIKQVRGWLETAYPDVWISGEISNFSVSPTGHTYFKIKDDKGILSAVLFKGHARGIPFKLEDGLEIVAHGNLSLYEKGGNFQLVVDYCEPKGVGALQLAFEQLKKKLEAEGLFRREHKVALPRFPRKIGVITSPTGAAIRDVINVLTRRFPNIDILLNPVRVQGSGAAEEIAAAIAEMNVRDDIDVLIVGRGGGSLEDLWAFNEEVVARAIFASKIPLISAVGHEIDFTIADFVADVRAATPSAAAELVVPEKNEILKKLTDVQKHLQLLVMRCFERLVERYKQARSHLKPPTARFPDLIIYIDNLRMRMNQTASRFMEQKGNRFKGLVAELNHLSPLAVLAKGYSVVKKGDSGKSVKSINELHKGDILNISLSEGSVEALVTKVID